MTLQIENEKLIFSRPGITLEGMSNARVSRKRRHVQRVDELCAPAPGGDPEQAADLPARAGGASLSAHLEPSEVPQQRCPLKLCVRLGRRRSICAEVERGEEHLARVALGLGRRDAGELFAELREDGGGQLGLPQVEARL